MRQSFALAAALLDALQPDTTERVRPDAVEDPAAPSRRPRGRHRPRHV